MKYFLFLLIIIPICSFSQVVNDNIENRIELQLNKPHFSETDNCTLQNECLNKELFFKQITYHNDQWFQFSVDNLKPYYINISKQNCRDVKGVQLIVVTGDPCKPDTYVGIKCVSLSTQDDIYVKLDSLTPKENYLLIVDGYLEDYCKFEIELSDSAKGLPWDFTGEPIKNNGFRNDDVTKEVSLNWDVSNYDYRSFTEYEVYRSDEKSKKLLKLTTILHQKYSSGVDVLEYIYNDTLLKPGSYNYIVFATKINGERVHVWSRRANLDFTHVKYTNHKLILSRTYKKSTPIEILITDAITDKVIISDFREASRDHQLFYNIQPALSQGTEKVDVKIKNLKKNKTEKLTIDWNQYLKK